MIIVYIVLAIFLLTVIFGAPYVPSKSKELDTALAELYQISSKDTLVDIGCGDGRVLKKARKHGAKTVGYEINPILALISKLRAPSAKIYLRDFRHAKFPAETTVIYVFGIERLMDSVYKIAQKLANENSHPVYIISYGFGIKNVQHHKKSGAFYLYKLT